MCDIFQCNYQFVSSISILLWGSCIIAKKCEIMDKIEIFQSLIQFVCHTCTCISP